MKKKTQIMAVILLITALLIFGCCACAKDTGTTPEAETAAPSDTSKPEGEALAGLAKVGDYVNYNAASGNGAGKSYTTEESLTGSNETATFSSSDEMKWVVMSVDKDAGTVVLMAENPTAEEVTLSGKTGYRNVETVLNDVGAVYGYGEGATGGRSITLDDLNKLENQAPEETTATYTYTEGVFLKDDGTEVTATEDNPVTLSYTVNATEKITLYISTTFSGKALWLATPGVYMCSSYCNYYVRDIYAGGVEYTGLYYSDLEDCTKGRGVVPVVTLEANIQTSGQDETGAWNLIVE